jgi:hypothetical protein
MRSLSVLFFISAALPVLAAVDFAKEEIKLAEAVYKSCGHRLRMNLHDYSYGRDEASVYSNRHFEDAALLASGIAEACRINPSNRGKLDRIRTIFIKRAGLGEGRLLQRKDGDLVFLASRRGSDLINQDLRRVLGLSFEKTPEPKAEDDKRDGQLAQAAAKRKVEDRDKKIAELTAWFQQEVKRISTNPPEDLGPKIEALKKTYEEKLHALTRDP